MIKSYSNLQSWLNEKYWNEKIPYWKWDWSKWFENTKNILDKIWHPELNAKFRIITWWTAGKWTTVKYIHEALKQQWLKVATFTSPDISCLTERFRFWDKLISEEDLINYANELTKIWEDSDLSSNTALTHVIKNTDTWLSFFEFIFWIFILMCKHKKPNIINLEVWCGWEFDATNTISWDRISVLTFTWEDHLWFIWNSLKEIAQTKSKIFNKNTIAWFSYEENFRDIIQNESPVKVKFIKNNWERSNTALAKKVCEYILNKKLEITKIPKIKLPARWEIIKKEWKTIILDWAHSKPRINEIIKKFQKIKWKKYLLLWVKKWRTGDFLKPLVNNANEVYLTEFDRNGNKSISLKELGLAFLSNSNYYNGAKKTPWSNIKFTWIKNPITALNKILNKMQKWETFLITWSFHLCWTIRDLFYPPEKILKQQTEFPKSK